MSEAHPNTTQATPMMITNGQRCLSSRGRLFTRWRSRGT